MAIEKVIIQNFKKYKEPFEICLTVRLCRNILNQ
ncbi:hypothetical protein C810_04449 [Lachnospiraceae bacterium A2]|nr:hypothetical protein C810_04449 [Lachnospiraceae bacterium A2]